MRKNMEKRNLNLIFMASNILIGVILGLFIVYSIKKEFNLSVFLGALTSTVVKSKLLCKFPFDRQHGPDDLTYGR